jgi:hypothetical protein
MDSSSILGTRCIYYIFYFQPDHQKIIGLMFFPAVTVILQFSNFKAPGIPTSLVLFLVLEVFIILVKSTTLSKF